MQTEETDFMPGMSESGILAGVRRFVMKNRWRALSPASSLVG